MTNELGQKFYVEQVFKPWPGGRPTNADWSYFNIQWGDEGMIVAVGWPAQWAAELVRDASRGVRIRAGQELVKTKLLPGEEIRNNPLFGGGPPYENEGVRCEGGSYERRKFQTFCPKVLVLIGNLPDTLAGL